MNSGKWYPEADMVVKHAKLYTVALTVEEVKAGKRDFPIYDDGGVAVKDGKIVYVGECEGVEQFVGEATEVIDAAGKMLVPGFVDSHIHATSVGAIAMRLDLSKTTSFQEMVDLTLERASKLKPGEWLEAGGWNELNWGEGASMPTIKDIDELYPDNPCLLFHLSYHVALVNSAALKLAGVTKDTPDPEGGRIGHYEDGELNGLLYEPSAIGLVRAAIPAPTDEKIVEVIEAAGKTLNGFGITSVVDPTHVTSHTRSYALARKRGKLTYRASIMHYLDAAVGNAEYHLDRLNDALWITGFGDDMLNVNGIKVLLDGIPAGYTAAFRRPYKTNPETCGSSVWSQEDLNKLVVKSNELGWQVGIHTIGDRAADMVLEAFQLAMGEESENDKRHYLIHVPFPQEDQFEVMKRLNVGVPVQPTLACIMGEAPILYDDQIKIKDGAGLFLKRGIIVGGSSDSPVMPPDVIKGMYYAVNRIDEVHGVEFDEESKVTATEALIMWTVGSAYFSHSDDVVGSLEVGKYGDMVILDRDFVAGDPLDIINAKIEKTILGGRIVYSA